MGIRHTDCVAMGHSRKRDERATSGCAGRKERWTEIPLRDGQQGRDAGPPWGFAGAKGEKRRPTGMRGGRTLRSGGKFSGAARPPDLTLRHTEWGRRKVGARPPDRRKTPGGGSTEWAGE